MSTNLPIREGRGRGGGARGDRGGRGGRGGDAGARGDQRGGRGRGDSSRGGGDGRGRGGPDRGGARGGGRGGRGGGPPVLFTHDPPRPARVDESIHIAEDQQLKKIHETPSSDAATPSRPGYGTKGDKVVLWANYLVMSTSTDRTLYRYNISLARVGAPGDVPKKLAKRVIAVFLEDNRLGAGVVSDFRSTLLSLAPLDVPTDGFTVQYRDENEEVAPPDARQYRVHVLPTGTLSAATLLNDITSSSLFGTKLETIQALNILVGHYVKADADVATLTRNRSYRTTAIPPEKTALNTGLEAIRGFIFSVRAATNRILVNVQVKNMAFYQSGPLLTIVESWRSGQPRSQNLNLGSLARFLSRLQVEVTHLRRTSPTSNRVIPRFKTINGFANVRDGAALPNPPRVARHAAGAKDVSFFLSDQPPAGSSGQASKKKAKKPAAGPAPASTGGRYITVYDFFKERYNITLSDSQAPVVNVGSSQNPSYLPMQVCEVRGGQPARSRLTPSQTQDMIRFSVRRPADNATSITTKGTQLFGFQPTNQRLTAFGVSVDPHMICVPGRVLAAPTLKYTKPPTENPQFGSWNLSGKTLVSPASLQKWTYLMVYNQGRNPPFSRDQLHAQLGSFATTLRQIGMTVNPCQVNVGSAVAVNPNDPQPQISEAVRKLVESQDRPTFILVVLPTFESTGTYNAVKYTCDVQYGLLNVCVVDTKFQRANEQYFANVGLKINLKLGGGNHAVEPAKLGVIGKTSCIVVGLDVTHPSPGSAVNAPSVAAIVASVDKRLLQWPAELRVQAARQEKVDALDELLAGRLRLWQKKNGSLPDNILIYRDGVSEGQYPMVLDEELPSYRSACQKLYPAADTKANKPKISIIVVGKRHHTRFYATSAGSMDRSGNPRNGTVVDRGVTEPANWDFFLQAHTAIQGTARPAHYFVVHDEIFQAQRTHAPFAHAADALEDLTHNMCYLFGRATKAVSICPPAYYADLACERARCFLSGLFGSDTASSVSGVPGGGSMDAGADSVRIHPRIQDAMFYI